MATPHPMHLPGPMPAAGAGEPSSLLVRPGGAHAVLTGTMPARAPTPAAFVGPDGGVEVDGPFYGPTPFTLVPREGRPRRFEVSHAGIGLRHQADEVARRL